MKAYIKKTDDLSLYEQAKCGFIKMGYEIVYYDKITEPVEDDCVVVGFISDIWNVAILMGFDEIKQLDYPNELKKYLKRDIKKIRLQDLPDKYPYFIKPTMIKSFTGRVVREFRDIIGIQDIELYFTETILDVVSEYRCFILNGEVLGVKHYKGSPYYSLNEEIVIEMVNCYTARPNAYSMDLGITRSGETILIECNNGYSSGNYGLPEILYANFLKQGWIDVAVKT